MTAYGWQGPVGNDFWSNASNWTPSGGPPGINDSVLIAGNGYSIDVTGISGAGSLNLGFSLGTPVADTLTVDNGGIGPDGKPVGSQDQRSKIRTFNIAPVWTHLISTDMVFTFGGYARQDQYNYYPSRDPFADLSPDLQLQTVGQNRTLTNLGARTSLAYVKGIHNLKAGATYQHTFLTEKDALGIVDPTANAPCLNADGSPDTSPSLTNPSGCTGSLTQNPGFLPLLGCYDLTRTGTLPASDGCPASTSGLYNYRGHTDIKELALFIQDSISIHNWNFMLGLRLDTYNGIATANS